MTLFRSCDQCKKTIPKNESFYNISIEKNTEVPRHEGAFYSRKGKLDLCNACTQKIHYDLWVEVNKK